MRDVARGDRSRTRGGDPAAMLAEITRYTKLFWINTGPYNNLTARKFVLELHARRVARRGAERGRATARSSGSGRRVDRRPARRGCAPLFFDPGLRADGHEQDAGRGRDILASSANNLYDGVTMADLEGFEERYRAELAPREARRPARRRGLRVGGRYDRDDRAHRRPPRGARSVRHRRRRRGARRAGPVLRDRRGRAIARRTTSRGCATAIRRGHDERLHRGLHGRARRQGRVGSARLLRPTREDREDPHARRRTRSGSRIACRGSAVPQADGAAASPRARSKWSSKPATRGR